MTRLVIFLITIFWLAMMGLLWRSEFGQHKGFGSAVPASMVWERILSAPDASALEIRRGSNTIGTCQVRADVGQELATGARVDDSEEPLEGMVQHLTSYRLDVEGAVAVPDVPQRARFGLMVKLDTNRVWKEFWIKIQVRPDIYEISGNAEEQSLRLHVDAGADKIDRTIRFSELQNPQQLLAELGGPALPLMLGMMGSRAGGNSTNVLQSLGIRWQAHNDALLFGRNSIRVYRLRGTFLNRYHANLYVSPVGEILRVELPNHITLVNSAVSTLRRAP